MLKKSFKKITLLTGIISFIFLLSSCTKDESEKDENDIDKGSAPVIIAFSIDNDNKIATLVFDQPVYASVNKTGSLEKSAFSLTLSGATVKLTNIIVDHDLGSNRVYFTIELEGIANGYELLTVSPSSANSIFSEKGAAVDISHSKSVRLNKEEDLGYPAIIKSITLSEDNESVLVKFDQPVYSNENKTGNLENSDFNLSLTGGTASLSDYSVTHNAGIDQVVISLQIDGIIDGTEVLTIAPSSDLAIFTEKGVAMAVTQSINAYFRDIGLIGKWQSSGSNLSQLLMYAGIDSIYCHFKTDYTYTIESFTSDGSVTTLSGNFSQERSEVTNIWNINVFQSLPTHLVSVGIFQLFTGDPISMKFETAQTDPQIQNVTPPTATGGFGSTSGGYYGEMNVQTYVKMR